MQLNSISTHKIAIIEAITNGIIFSIFENDLKNTFVKNSVLWQLDKNQTTKLTIAEFEQKQAYEFLATLPEFENFEISESKNWKFETRPIRLIVDKKKLTPHLLSADAVGQLVSFVLNDAEIKAHTIDNATEESIYIYLNFLLPEHKLIIENSDCIVIDLR